MPDNTKRKRISVSSIIISIAGLISLLGAYLFMNFEVFSPQYSILIATLVFIICVFIVFLVKIIRMTSKKEITGEIQSNFEIVTKGFLSNIDNPIVMCDNQGKIIWYNDAFIKQTGKRTPLYSKYLDDLTDATIERITKEEDKRGAIVSFLSDNPNLRYRAKGFNIKSGKNEYSMTIFFSNEEVDKLERQLEDEDTVISLITVDNLDDVTKTTTDSIEKITVEIASILREYASHYEAIIKDAGKNRFLFIFERKHLQDMIDNKFSIIDEVRDLSINISVPITISIGVADYKGSIDMKYVFASQALELALQRGGDQVVVKSSEGNTFYGGKTRGVQRTTKVRARVIANQVYALIKKSSNVLIMGHRNADFDAIASAVGVSRICKEAGVDVNVICDKNDENLKEVFALLKGEEYTKMLIDSNEALDLIQSNTLCIICDVNNLAICEAPDVVNNVNRVVIIDHHRKIQDYSFTPEILYIEPNASSASELVSEFLEQLMPNTKMPKVEMDLLFSGILLDTKKLTHNTGIRTFSALQYLRGQGADPSDVENLFKVSLKELSSEAKYEAGIVLYKSIIAIAFNQNDENSPLARVIAARAADKMLTVNGIMASFALCKIGDSVHISARSTGKINVQLILEKMGGGGHFDAAGAFVKNTTEKSVMDALRKAIDEYFEEQMNK